MTEFAEHQVERLDACDLCGTASERAQRLFVKQGLPVTRCKGCGVLYVNPRLRQEHLWHRYSQEYFEYYLRSHGAYDERRNYAIHAPYLRELQHYLPARGRLLEFGAAMGFFLAAARLDGWDVTGNELSQFAANYAAQEFGIPMLAGSADQVQLPPRSFDAVVMFETIEHVQSPRRVLQRAAELLRPGGVLALSTPNISSVSYFFLRERWWVVMPIDHIYYFSPRTVRYALERVGFEVLHVRTEGADSRYFLNTLLGRSAMPQAFRSVEQWKGVPALNRSDSQAAPRPHDESEEPQDAAQVLGSERPVEQPKVTEPLLRSSSLALRSCLRAGRSVLRACSVPVLRQILYGLGWADTVIAYAVRKTDQ